MRTPNKNIFVMTAAFISVMLLIVARHHPPSRRKIKEIWHGRVYWESNTNTTMLRSSPEKVLEQVEPTPAEDSTMLWSSPEKVLEQVEPTPVEDSAEKTIARVSKPMIAICAATHSKSNWRSLDDTALQNTLIPSIEKTISTSDRSKYDFRLYLAADHDDHFWLQNQNNVKTPDWLSVHIGFYNVPEHKIPFNPMMRTAYNDGAEYMVRINDDSEFMTSDWVSKAVAKLASYDPPNVGMVGPNCREGNTAIMTHDMVHRTHLDIFEHYYPEVFSAWWIDDWISKVYGPERSTKMMDWTVKHHTHKHGTRYAVQHHEAQLLQGELEKGGEKIEKWLSKTDKSEPNMRVSPLQKCIPKSNVLFLSQSNEDKAIVEQMYGDQPKCGGTIVEIGALNGISYSNSWYFEQALQWKALLIEANPQNFKELQINRPNALNVHSAMCTGKSIDFIGSGAVGGMVDTMSTGHNKAWVRPNEKSVRVPCQTFKPLFSKYGIHHVDVFILDVEGGEYEVLKTMDWSVTVGVWVVELDKGDLQKDANVREELRKHGYIPATWDIRDWCSKGKDCTSNEVFVPAAKVVPTEKRNRVISYSLYASNPRYTDGALANAKLIKEIYPDWSMRVYYDSSVPRNIIEQLRADHVQLVDMSGSKMNKMSWRFQAAADTQRFCARDIDSRLSKREAAAVQEWIQSGKKFHVMRDHPSHSKYPMSGGMWCSTTIPNMEAMLTDVKNQAYLQDMNFLNNVIWPMAQKSLLQHDSFSCDKFGGGKPFPTPRVGWEHVGSVYINGKMRQGDVDILKRSKQPCVMRDSQLQESANEVFVPANKPVLLQTNIKQVGAYGSFKTSKFAPISSESMRRYCSRVGCNYVQSSARTVPSRSPLWEKVNIIRQYLSRDNVAMIIWADSDVVATPSAVNLPKMSADILLTLDYGASVTLDKDKINTGVMFIQNTPWSKQFFEKVWSHNDGGTGKNDQYSINHVLKTLSTEEKKKHVQIIDRKKWNAFPIWDGVTNACGIKGNGDATENSAFVHFAGWFGGICPNGKHHMKMTQERVEQAKRLAGIEQAKRLAGNEQDCEAVRVDNPIVSIGTENFPIVFQDIYPPIVYTKPTIIGTRPLFGSSLDSRGFRFATPEAKQLVNMSMNIIVQNCGAFDRGIKWRGGTFDRHGYIIAAHAGAKPAFHLKNVKKFTALGVGLLPYSHLGGTHFWADTAPNVLTLLDKLPQDIPIVVVLNTKTRPLYKLLDIDITRLIAFDAKSTYVASKLYSIVPYPYGMHGKDGGEPISFQAYQRVKQHIVDLPQIPLRERKNIVVISRKDRTTRRCSNHQELMATIQKQYGSKYNIVEFVGDDHSHTEAMDIFSHANVVVGPHGGAFMNLIYVAEGTRVVEIGYDDTKNMPFPSYFFIFAQKLSLNYSVVIGKGSYGGSIECPIDDVITAIGEEKSSVKSCGHVTNNLLGKKIQLACSKWTHEFKISVEGDIIGWEPQTHSKLHALLRKHHPKAAFQAGMHVGDSLIPMAMAFPNVHFVGVDPDPSKCEFVAQMISLNSITNIDIIHGGIDSIGHACSLDTSHRHAAMWKIVDGDDLQCYTIDDLASRFEEFELIHLDLEGAEYRALQGATKTLKKTRPMLIFENDHLKERKEMYTMLQIAGYSKESEVEHNEFWFNKGPEQVNETPSLDILLPKLINFVGGNVKKKDSSFKGTTMQSETELRKLATLIETIVSEDTMGDIYETGCWRGGTSLFMAAVFEVLNSPRNYFLFDSFAGFAHTGDVAMDKYLDNDFYIASKENIESDIVKLANLIGKPDFPSRFHLIKGYFEETLQTHIPDSIAILRLDGDLYSSTAVVLEKLYSSVSTKGWVIIDDYTWNPPRDKSTKIAKEATDEFRAVHNIISPMVDKGKPSWQKVTGGNSRKKQEGQEMLEFKRGKRIVRRGRSDIYEKLRIQPNVQEAIDVVNVALKAHKDWTFTGNVASNEYQMYFYTSAAEKLQGGNICETGFNAGHSSAMFLSANKNIRYYGWDLGEFTASHHICTNLQNIYGAKRVTVNWGDAKKTVPEFFRESHIKCNLLIVDGEHTFNGVKLDLTNFANSMTSAAGIFIDDCANNVKSPVKRRTDGATNIYKAVDAFLATPLGNKQFRYRSRIDVVNHNLNSLGFCRLAPIVILVVLKQGGGKISTITGVGQVKQGNPAINSFELFDNWVSWIPSELKSHIVVHCMDTASMKHIQSVGMKCVNNSEYAGLTTDQMCVKRIEIIEKYLKEGNDVLVSDTDAIWLQSPLTLLNNIPGDIVGLRGNKWHTMNCGFILFRQKALGLMDEWKVQVLKRHHDQESLNMLFRELEWQEGTNGLTHSTLTATKGPIVVTLLPANKFTRFYHTMYVEPCQANPETITGFPPTTMYCIDKRVIIHHNKGDIFLSRKKKDGIFWHSSLSTNKAIESTNKKKYDRHQSLSVNNDFVSTIWSNDFHISTIGNIKTLLKGSVNFIDKSLSGHCHLTNTCATNLKVLTKSNGISPDANTKARFVEAYKEDPEMKTVDIVMCLFPSAMCELFMTFNKRLFVIAAVRYEQGRESITAWKEWNNNLLSIYKDSANLVAANNLYDAKYIEYFTGIPAQVIPEWVPMSSTWKGTSTDILVATMHSPNVNTIWNLLRKTSSRFKNLKDKYGHYTFKQLCENTAIIHFPYQTSVMSLFEQYGMGIPILVPSPEFLWELHDKYDIVTERTWQRVRTGKRSTGSPLNGVNQKIPDPNNDIDKDAFLHWIQYADYYQWPHIIQFGSWDGLKDILLTVDWKQVSKDMIRYHTTEIQKVKNTLLTKINN